MRILIVGLGSIGKRHFRNLRALGQSDFAFCRTAPDPLPEAPDVPVYTDLAEALDQGPSLVIVSNPSPMHLAAAMPAARAGCHLFIEKPLSSSLEGVDELVGLVRRNGTVGMVGFDLRFEPGLLHVERLLSDGALGRVLSVQAHVGQYLKEWRQDGDYRRHVSARAALGGGVILELIHEFDYLSWLIGRVTAISCMSGHVSTLEMDAEDVAVCLLRFANGAIGGLHLDCVQRTPSRGCRIICEDSTVVWDALGKTVEWSDPATTSWRAFRYAETERNDRLLAEMAHLLRCVQGLETPRVDLSSSAETLRVALAAKRSAETGGPVTLGQE